MALFGVISMPCLLVFLLGFFVGRSHSRSDVPSLASTLRFLRASVFEFDLSDKARAATASKILANVEIEMLYRYQVEQIHKTGTWQRRAYEDFVGALVTKDKVLPCIYGTKGYKANELDFCFLESEHISDLEVAKSGAKAIVEYHKILHTRGRNISLVLLCPPPFPGSETSVEDYHMLFWSFLKNLRQLDPKVWPKKVPHNTEDRLWCMNFDSMEAFIAVLTPAHKQRLSRYAPNLAMVYQPRAIFDTVFRDVRIRETATKTVRGLVDKYDRIPHSPDISNYAHDGTTESRQYFLLDKNEPAICPYQDLDVAARNENLGIAGLENLGR